VIELFPPIDAVQSVCFRTKAGSPQAAFTTILRHWRRFDGYASSRERIEFEMENFGQIGIQYIMSRDDQPLSQWHNQVFSDIRVQDPIRFENINENRHS
jgi:hypothetical protein